MLRNIFSGNKENLLKKCVISLIILVVIFSNTWLVMGEGANFTMTSETLNVKASDVIAIEGAFTYDETKYARNGAVLIGSNSSDDVPEEIKGQIFLHGGAGDKYTFTVDFNDYQATKLAYAGYGLSSPTKFSVKADGELLGYGEINGGNGWLDNNDENWQFDEIVFEKPITGLKTIEIEVTESAPQWPANAFGNFVFSGSKIEPATTPETTEEVTENPGTDDNNNIEAWILISSISVLGVLTMMVLKKKSCIKQ